MTLPAVNVAYLSLPLDTPEHTRVSLALWPYIAPHLSRRKRSEVKRKLDAARCQHQV